MKINVSYFDNTYQAKYFQIELVMLRSDMSYFIYVHVVVQAVLSLVLSMPDCLGLSMFIADMLPRSWW